MAKKESVKRGMTKRAIKGHLKKDDDDLWELSKILKRKSLLSPKTRNNAYHVLDSLYAREVKEGKRGYFAVWFDSDLGEKLDLSSRDRLDYLTYLNNLTQKRGELAEDMGDYKKAVEFYNKARKLHLKVQNRAAIRNEYYASDGIRSRLQKSEDGFDTKAKSSEEIEKLRLMGKNGMKSKASLEKTAAATSIIGLIGGIFFLSPNITGNVIGNLNLNLNQTSSNVIGVGLLVVGAIAGWFWNKKSNKNIKTKANSKKVRKKKR